MSNVVVITFDRPEEAGLVREQLRQLEHRDLLNLEDAAVIVKNQGGKVDVHNEVSSTMKAGVGIGALVGVMVGFIFFPIAGAALGAGGGALVAKTLDKGVDRDFVREVSAALKPGNSAIFLIIHDANADAALAALRPFKGHIYQTSLGPEAEEALRNALEDRT